jgi:outer membrane cobalamin receptor
MKIDNLLDADYEQVLGFSRAGIHVRGGVTVNF